jgi:hypothetical protein
MSKSVNRIEMVGLWCLSVVLIVACSAASVRDLPVATVASTATASVGIGVIGDLPIYPGATEPKPGEDEVVDTFMKATEAGVAALNSMNRKADTRIFKLPTSVECDEVVSFYADGLRKADWIETRSTLPELEGFEEGVRKLPGWQYQSVRFAEGEDLSVRRVDVTCMSGQGASYLFVLFSAPLS